MLKLDHLVILVDDLDQAVADYTQLGFQVTPGGTHADGLTRNALIVFRDGTYLELITFVDSDDTRENTWSWRQYLQQGGGLIDYCAASDDLAADVAALRAAGLDAADPVDGGRTRPDGVALRWRSSRIGQSDRELPFLIEDVTPRSLRVPSGDAAEHPNGAIGIEQLIVHVADLAATARQFAAMRNDTAESALERASEDIVVALGPHAVRLTERPDRPDARGGPAGIVLDRSAGNAQPIEAALTHGVSIAWRDQ